MLTWTRQVNQIRSALQRKVIYLAFLGLLSFVVLITLAVNAAFKSAINVDKDAARSFYSDVNLQSLYQDVKATGVENESGPYTQRKAKNVTGNGNSESGSNAEGNLVKSDLGRRYFSPVNTVVLKNISDTRAGSLLLKAARDKSVRILESVAVKIDENASKNESGVRIPGVRPWRLFCWVLTMPENLSTRTRYIRATWGKRCDKTVYFSSKEDENFPTVGLNTGDGKHHFQAQKAIAAWKYVQQHHLNDYDFFYKADDDTYAVIENLR